MAVDVRCRGAGFLARLLDSRDIERLMDTLRLLDLRLQGCVRQAEALSEFRTQVHQ